MIHTCILYMLSLHINLFSLWFEYPIVDSILWVLNFTMFSPQIGSKFTLGFSGILAVLFSVLSSVCFWSFVREPATLIIIEVVLFFVLAVGLYNIFILVQAYLCQDQHAEGDVPHKIGRVLGEVAPSMLLTSLSESVAFAIGEYYLTLIVNDFEIKHVHILRIYNEFWRLLVLQCTLCLK